MENFEKMWCRNTWKLSAKNVKRDKQNILQQAYETEIVKKQDCDPFSQMGEILKNPERVLKNGLQFGHKLSKWTSVQY